MQKYIDILKTNTLFDGVKTKDILPLLNYIKPKIKSYIKGSFIIMAATPVQVFGIVLSGLVQIVKDDIAGNRSIIAACAAGDTFATALAAAQTQESPVSVVAQENSAVMLFDFAKIVNPIAPQPMAAQLIKNMLMVFACKNIYLNSKLEHVSKRTIRAKLLSYLHEQQTKAGTRSFTIPLNKTHLADFLFINRSAMCRELSLMQKCGIFSFKGNAFKLNKGVH